MTCFTLAFILFYIHVPEYYPNHIDSLVQQCMEWCDSHNLPLIVPLSSWLPDPRTSLVTTVDCPDGVQRLCVTPNGQHMFCTTPKNEVYMYHVPSKKLIRTFAGKVIALNVSFCQMSGTNILTYHSSICR